MCLYIYRFRVDHFTEQGPTALRYEVFSFLQQLSEDLKLHNWYGCKVALNEIKQSFESSSLMDQSQGYDEDLCF